MALLALDDVDRQAFSCELNGVGVAYSTRLRRMDTTLLRFGIARERRNEPGAVAYFGRART